MNASAARPVVGLTTYLETARWGDDWSGEAALLPSTYLRSVVDAGAVPVLLPPLGTDPAVLERLDGLVVTGGADVAPERYGAEPHPTTVPQPWRDEHELRLIAAAEELGLPMLCVCRGFQLLDVAHGGTLHQDLPSGFPGGQRYVNEGTVFNTNTVSTEPGTLIASIVGTDCEVSSYHHQGVREIGTGLKVTARSDDGLPQALEYQEPGAWMLATQFHPEERRLADPRIFRAFVAACRERSARTGA